MTLHPKIKELKQRALPVTNSTLYIDKRGELVNENTIKGYALVWGIPDSYRTVFLKGCCSKSIQERGPQSNSKYKITKLWQHDQRDPIGQVTVLIEDDYGLYFEAAIDAEEVNGARALRQVASGTINQFSIGFDYVWDKMEYYDDKDIILIKEIDLFEISAVTIGAQGETYAMRSPEDVESAKEQLQEETEYFIKSLPRKQQLEARQLFARQISLATFKPDALRQKPLEGTEPVAAGLDPTFIQQHLKIV